MSFFSSNRSSLKNHEQLDFAVSQVPYLLFRIERSFKQQMMMLKAKNGKVREVQLRLICEYGEEEQLIKVAPYSSESSDEQIFKLLEHQISYIDLSNPIREFELVILPERWSLPVDEFLDFQLSLA